MHTECWSLRQPFRIAGKTEETATAIVVELSDGDCTGRGEAQGVPYFGETADTMLVQVEAVAAAVRDGASRADLPELLPAGGARNAIDCTLWDLLEAALEAARESYRRAFAGAERWAEENLPAEPGRLVHYSAFV